MAATFASGKVRKNCQTSATARLKQDYIRIKSDPVPYICAEPLHSNILEWYVYQTPCVLYKLKLSPPFPPVDCTRAMMLVWKEDILFSVVYVITTMQN